MPRECGSLFKTSRNASGGCGDPKDTTLESHTGDTAHSSDHQVAGEEGQGRADICPAPAYLEPRVEKQVPRGRLASHSHSPILGV